MKIVMCPKFLTLYETAPQCPKVFKTFLLRLCPHSQTLYARQTLLSYQDPKLVDIISVEMKKVHTATNSAG